MAESGPEDPTAALRMVDHRLRTGTHPPRRWKADSKRSSRVLSSATVSQLFAERCKMQKGLSQHLRTGHGSHFYGSRKSDLKTFGNWFIHYQYCHCN